MTPELRICTVVGARPQFIKAAMVSRAIESTASGGNGPIDETLLHTGQHFDDNMSDVFFRELGIRKPTANLGINSVSHAAMTAEMLVALEGEFLRHKPRLVLVYGDTDSTLAAALAAAKLRIPVAHVEAGPRTFNREHPEEINRLIADHLSELRFCPTEHARANLSREGIEDGAHVVGDVMLDAVLAHKDQAPRTSFEAPYVVATIHRRQNTDDRARLAGILEGLGACPHPVVLPVHPRAREALDAHGLALPDNIRAVEPLSYLEMLAALGDCQFVVSDSGGLPKEAYFLGKRSLTICSETAWPELLEIEATRVVDCDPATIREGFDWAAAPPPAGKNPFGRGDSGRRIVDVLTSAFPAG